MKEIMICLCINQHAGEDDQPPEIMHAFAMDHGNHRDVRTIAHALGYGHLYLDVTYARLYEKGDLDIPSLEILKSKKIELQEELDKINKALAEGVRKPK